MHHHTHWLLALPFALQFLALGALILLIVVLILWLTHFSMGAMWCCCPCGGPISQGQLLFAAYCALSLRFRSSVSPCTRSRWLCPPSVGSWRTCGSWVGTTRDPPIPWGWDITYSHMYPLLCGHNMTVGWINHDIGWQSGVPISASWTLLFLTWPCLWGHGVL